MESVGKDRVGTGADTVTIPVVVSVLLMDENLSRSCSFVFDQSVIVKVWPGGCWNRRGETVKCWNQMVRAQGMIL